MIGITLTDEQIRNAPPPVRQWIEQQVVASLGVMPQPAAAPPPQAAHLVACSVQDAEAILTQIQDQLSAVNVFFEFGRPTVAYGQPPVMVFRLLDILYHTRLHDIGQVMACLEMINQALARTRRDGSARFCAFDNEGHCLIPSQTQESIAMLWQQVAVSPQPADRKPERAVSAA
jgi:hypothetical protein